MKFSPLQFFLLLFPEVLLQLIVTQTNLYYLQSQPARMERLLSLEELYVWMGLHIKMMRHWSHDQDAYFLGRGAFNARVFMSRRRFYWIKSSRYKAAAA